MAKGKIDKYDKLTTTISKAGFDLQNEHSLNVLLELIEEIGEIRKRYKNNPLHHLSSFDDTNHLEKYIASAYNTNKCSKDNALDHFKFNHILFKIIKQNYISLYTLLSYQFNNLSLSELKDAYETSGEIQKSLALAFDDKNKSVERLAWFINLKNPVVYWNTPQVKEHYSMMLSHLVGNPKIDIRRMHLFYNDYTTKEYIKNSELKTEQIKAVFQGLFFERLIGIDSRLIVIKNFTDIENEFFFYNPKDAVVQKEKSDDEAFLKSVFLLDYALYQYPDNKTTINDEYEHYLLPANFTIEPPIKSYEEKRNFEKDYEDETVYKFYGSSIYYIFKRNFKSIWYKKSYIRSLDNLIIHKAWRIIKKNKESILIKIFNDRKFINKIKSSRELFKKTLNTNISEFAENVSFENEDLKKKFINDLNNWIKSNLIEINNEIARTDKEGFIKYDKLNFKSLFSIESLFSSFHVDSSVKEDFAENLFILIENTNLLIRCLFLHEEKYSIIDYFKHIFINNNDELFNKDSNAFSPFERELLYLIFSNYNEVVDVIFENHLGEDTNDLEKEIYTIRNIFDKNIEVVDFFDFWKKIMLEHKIEIEELLSEIFIDFDNKQGSSNFISMINSKNDSKYSDTDLSEIRNELITLCREFYEHRLSRPNKKETINQKFNQKFYKFIIGREL